MPLPGHTGQVGVVLHALSRPDEAFRLGAVQGQGPALDKGRVDGRHVLLNGDGDPSHQVVEDPDGRHRDLDIVVDGGIEQKGPDGIHGVFAALHAAVAVVIGQAQLLVFRAAVVPQHIQPGHIRHGVPVQLEDLGGARLGVHDHQGKEIRLMVVVEGLDPIGLLLIPFRTVGADEQHRLEMGPHGILLSVIEEALRLHRGILGQASVFDGAFLFSFGHMEGSHQQADQHEHTHKQQSDFFHKVPPGNSKPAAFCSNILNSVSVR